MARLVGFILCISFFASALAQTDRIPRGSAVYVVAGSLGSRKSAWSPNLDLMRSVENSFRKDKAHRLEIAPSLASASLVFLVAQQPGSADTPEMALALRVSDYRAHERDFETLRNLALWSSEHAIHGRADHALVRSTAGLSLLFHRPSAARALVKQFLAEAVGS